MTKAQLEIRDHGGVVAFGLTWGELLLGCGGALLAHRARGESVFAVAEGATGNEAGILPQQLDAGAYGEGLVDAIRNLIERQAARLVYLPAPSEPNPSRRALGLAGIEAVRRVQNGCRVALYELDAPLSANLILPIDAAAPLAALLNQAGVPAPERAHAEALHRYRAFGSGAAQAEALQLLDAASPTASPAQLLSVTRSEAVASWPQVSVIVRTMHRPELPEALASIAAQTWPAIEVVLVDAAGSGVPPPGERCGDYPLRKVSLARQLPRAQAANAGLDEARGDYLLFLDEDDWLAPEHIAGLMALLQHGSALAAYAGIQGAQADGSVAGHLPLFNDPYDPQRLKWGNYIPIHAVLFSRRLLEQGCRFDESMEVYEDWDFWLQVASHTPLLHLPRVTGFYRAAGESGVGGVTNSREREAAWRARVLAKWAARWSGDELLTFLEFLNQGATLSALRQQVSGLEEQVMLRERHIQTLRSVAQERERERDEAQLRLTSAEEHARQFKRIVDDMEGSSSWRLTAPLRLAMRLARSRRQDNARSGEAGTIVYKVELFKLQEGPFGGARVMLLAGWALDRATGRGPKLLLRANGATLAEVNCTIARADVARGHAAAVQRRMESADFGFDAVLYIDEQVGRITLETELGWVIGDTRMVHAGPDLGLPLTRRLKAVAAKALHLAALARRKVTWRDLRSPARWRYFYGKGLQELARLRRQAEPDTGAAVPPLDRYEANVRNHHINDAMRALLTSAVGAFAHRPVFSIVMPVYNVEARWLRAAIESVRNQIYPHWQLCIADDRSTRQETIDCLKGYEGDERIRITWRPENGHICHASNSAADQATGDFVVLMDQDDVLQPQALFELARLLQRHPEADLLYTDEDKVDIAEHRYDVHFKPDWSPTLFLGYNYINHITCIRRSLFEAVGRFRPGFEGAQDYDLLLRVTERTSAIHHVAQVLYDWRAIPESTASASSVKPIVKSSAEQALREHLERCGLHGEFYVPEFAQQHRLPIYQLDGADEGPTVAILIPARNQHEVTARCVASIRSKTRYRNYRVLLIDNGSDDPAAIAWYKQQFANGVDVKRIESPAGRFSFSHLMNAAAHEVEADYLLLLNNDTEVIEPRWLSRMMAYAQLPGVGAVGARLLYPNGALQHAGVILGMGKDAAPGHAFYRLPGNELSCFFQAETARDVTAVTAACLLTPRSLYMELGGFDEEHLPISLNDVDYCLRAAEQGLRSVYVAGAELIHHESLSRTKEDDPIELAWFKQRHGGAAERYYNPHLSVDGHYLPRPDSRLDYLAYLGRPLKVLFYSHNLNLEGAPKVVMNVALGLKAAGGFEPVFLSPCDGPGRRVLEANGIACTVLPPRGTDNILTGWSNPADFQATVDDVARFIADSGADLVVANVLNCFFAVNAAAQLGIPAIWIIHESYDRARMYHHIPAYGIDACEQAFEQAAKVVFVSEETRRMYARYDRLRNATVVYNGLDPELIEHAAQMDREGARAALGLAPETKALITVGTLCERKDQETLVRAAAELARQRGDFVCYIVGARPGAPYYDYVHRLIERHRLTDKVILVEETPHVERYYAAADLFVFTSLNESYSLTVLEAMAYALPIVTTPVCGVGEQVRFGVNAVGVGFRAHAQLARTLADLMDNPAQRAEMGRASRAMLAYMPGYPEMLQRYRGLVAAAWSAGYREPVADKAVGASSGHTRPAV